MPFSSSSLIDFYPITGISSEYQNFRGRTQAFCSGALTQKHMWARSIASSPTYGCPSVQAHFIVCSFDHSSSSSSPTSQMLDDSINLALLLKTDLPYTLGFRNSKTPSTHFDLMGNHILCVLIKRGPLLCPFVNSSLSFRNWNISVIITQQSDPNNLFA
jgi:hypothetical protein